MRYLLRFLSLVGLAAATIAGALDSIQSVAASKAVITSLADAWKGLDPSSFDSWALFFSDPGRPHLYHAAVGWVLSQPAFAVMLAASLLLWIVAYRRAPARYGMAT